jgi:CBS domain-containing protein
MDIKKLAKEAVLIRQDATYRDAIQLMITKQTNSLLVVDENGALCGEVKVSELLDAIVPETLDGDMVEDVLGTEEKFRKAVKNAENKEVQEFMSYDIQPVHVDDELITIAGTAIAHGTAHIPIVDHDNRPIGIISRRGIKHILAKYLDIEES